MPGLVLSLWCYLENMEGYAVISLLCVLFRSGHGGTDDRKYEIKLEFYKGVDPGVS